MGEESAVLRAGDAYYFKSHQPHTFRNPGNEPCELIYGLHTAQFLRRLPM